MYLHLSLVRTMFMHGLLHRLPTLLLLAAYYYLLLCTDEKSGCDPKGI